VSALADNDGVRPPAEPLGTLLLKRGLITQEQLSAALEAQKGSGEPLGAIVVAQGFATPATVAQALATQSGGLLKTEYGFATGFGAGTDRPIQIGEPPISTARIGGRPGISAVAVAEPAPAQAAEQPATTTALAEAPTQDPQVDELAADRDAVRAELAAASVESERLTSANERLTEVRAELEQRLAHETQRAASLESELASRDATVEEFRAATVAWQAAHAELEQRLALQGDPAAAAELPAAAHEELEELREAAAAAESARVDLEERLAQELAAAALRHETIAELRLALDEAVATPPEPETGDRWAAAERHLLFFQGSEAYELVERAGPPPGPGMHVEVAGISSAQIVARIGSAPVPGTALPCAYLLAAGRPAQG
jgi:hypothetical protein